MASKFLQCICVIACTQLFVCCGLFSGKKDAEQNFAVLKKSTLYKNTPAKFLFPIQEGKKWGFINEEGKKVIETRFADIGSFNEELCAARVGGKYGYINKTGNWAIQPKFTVANNFSDGLAQVFENGKHYFIDKNGTVVLTPSFESVSDFSEGFSIVKTNNYKYGFINKTGKLVIDTIYERVEPFTEGFAIVNRVSAESSGNWDMAFIDTSGKIVVPFGKYKNARSFSDGLAYVEIESGGRTKTEKDGRITDIPGIYGFIDKKGKLLFSFNDDRYLVIDDFKNGLAMVSKTYPDPDGFINKQGQLVINNTLEEARSFSENLAPVKKQKWGFINATGKIIIPNIYEDVTFFKNGIAKAYTKKKIEYINQKGTVLWSDTIIDYKETQNPDNVYLDSLNIAFKARGYVNVYPEDHLRELKTEAKTISEALHFENKKFYIRVNINQRSIFYNGYLGGKMYIINTTDSAMSFSTQDNRLYCILQAKNKNGEWCDIEYLPSSWCGNSYYNVTLGKNKYWECIVPVYQGEYKTQLRYKLLQRKKAEKTIFYSNEFEGRINLSQFENILQGHEPTSIMDPYID